MTTDEFRAWQDELTEDYRRMAGLVAALVIALSTICGAAIYLVIAF